MGGEGIEPLRGGILKRRKNKEGSGFASWVVTTSPT